MTHISQFELVDCYLTVPSPWRGRARGPTSRRDASVESVANFLLDANIVVRELPHISVIDTKNLGLLISAECETRNGIHDP